MPLISLFPVRRILKWACFILCGSSRFVGAATFTVTIGTDNDSGSPVIAGSLRWAIMSANAGTAGPNVIDFNVGPGPGVTITPHSPLTVLTAPVTIDGTTQPGFQGTPIVELSGVLAGGAASGIHITGGNCTIRGLVINRFSDSGIRIELNGGNVIEGNFIGTDVTGLLGFGNSNEGIVVENGASNNRIGGLQASARNVICNNKQTGIFVRDGAANNLILGNYIGVDASGGTALGNSTSGVLIKTANNVVGGDVPGARNLIAGNGWSGVYLYLSGAVGNVVQGNFIGADATGTLAVGNKDRGVVVLDGSGNIIGGLTVAARNLISGNRSSGILIDGLGAGNVVQGNYIGTDVTGMTGLGNAFDGVEIRSARNNTIGGSEVGAGNLISGNRWSGVSIFQSAFGNIVQGNLVGTKADGVGALGNVQYGVWVYYSGANNVIGGVGGGQGNVIAFNCAGNPSYDGVRLHSTAGQGNRVSGNSIFANNAGQGIDIGGNGVTLNDSVDADQLQNFPVLTCAASRGVRTIIYGTLASVANETFTVEVFSSSAVHPTGFGAGERFHGFTPVTTDASGTGRFAIACATAALAGPFISATATNVFNATSEFSADVLTTSADSDGDGLPDAFETAFALSPNDPRDAPQDADRDGDGLSDMQEFLAGTDPSDPSSALRITKGERFRESVVVGFPSVYGIRYRLETTPNLLAPWATALENIVGTGSTVFTTMPTMMNATKGFYRIVATP